MGAGSTCRDFPNVGNIKGKSKEAKHKTKAKELLRNRTSADIVRASGGIPAVMLGRLKVKADFSLDTMCPVEMTVWNYGASEKKYCGRYYLYPVN